MTDASPVLGAGGFSRLLVVCDGEDADADRAALQRALEIAARDGAALHLLSVVEPPSEIERIAQAVGLSAPAAVDRLTDERRAELKALADEVGGGPDLAPDVRVGKPFLEIIRAAIAMQADLVVKAPVMVSGLFASTDQHLLRKCPCPVWLYRPETARPLGAVVASVDVDPTTADGETGDGLNRRILETAAAIARIDGAALHLVHAWEAPAEGLVRRWAGDEKEVIDYVAGVEADHRRALRRLRDALADALPAAERDRLFIHVLRGPPRDVIPAQAEELAADLLVMGTIARTGVPGFIIGNTAEDILNAVTCSVVTVKPPGYVSPVAHA